jgi:hypothetical protein
MKAGDNVTCSVQEGKLNIQVDLTAAMTPSKSGKMDMLGSTHGFVTLEVEGLDPQDQPRLSLNIGVPVRKRS